jgi:hypothetical protein
MQEKKLGFTWSSLAESELFKGLHAKKIKTFLPSQGGEKCPRRMPHSFFRCPVVGQGLRSANKKL